MGMVFIFPPNTPAETTVLFDAIMPGGDGYWHDGELQVEVDSEDRRLGLFGDGGPEDVHRARFLLRNGGVAVDDYFDHCWTLQEIESDLKIDGLGFFDFCGRYAKHYAT